MLVPALLARGGEESAWKKLRPDAPAEPEAEPYKWKEPEGWTPPSREELEKLPWKGGRVADEIDCWRERVKGVKPLATVDEALATKNEGEEANSKICSVLCQPPASDD